MTTPNETPTAKEIRHEDCCRFHRDGEFCDCGADIIDRLERELALANERAEAKQRAYEECAEQNEQLKRENAVLNRLMLSGEQRGIAKGLDERDQLKRELAEVKAQLANIEHLFYGGEITSHAFEGLPERLMNSMCEFKKELREWQTLRSWGYTPKIVDEFIKGQQCRIHAVQDVEKERDQLKAENERLKTTITELRNNAALQGRYVAGVCEEAAYLREENPKWRTVAEGLAMEARYWQAIRSESCGVAGWHLNGVVAAWDEFNYCDSTALAAFDKLKGEGK